MQLAIMFILYNIRDIGNGQNIHNILFINYTLEILMNCLLKALNVIINYIIIVV